MSITDNDDDRAAHNESQAVLAVEEANEKKSVIVLIVSVATEPGPPCVYLHVAAGIDVMKDLRSLLASVLKSLDGGGHVIKVDPKTDGGGRQ